MEVDDYERGELACPCAACGETIEAHEMKCGACGFSREELRAAERAVNRVAAVFGVDLSSVSPETKRRAVDVVLGEIVPA